MTNQHIHVLEPFLANQIAAGEVVERPGSVVKELLENSIDAQATKLDIVVEQGGSSLIRIRDDGCGISKEDLPLALQRHATSKIQSVEDLFCIKSLGFRGEALASISSVARINLTSKTQDADNAWQIKMEGSNDNIAVIPASHPQGTTIEVSDLFFNVPARRKFLRTAQTEFSHILETVRRLALTRFDIAIYLQHNAKSILRFDVSKSQKDEELRLAAICGDDFVKQAIVIGGEATDMKVRGWIGLPTFTRSQPDLQYLYVNGRIVRDKTLAHAIRQSYQDVIADRRYPGLVLFLDIDPALVDVNVHPTKSEVRFRETRAVHDFIMQIIRRALASGGRTMATNINVVSVNEQNTQDNFASSSQGKELQEFVVRSPDVIYSTKTGFQDIAQIDSDSLVFQQGIYHKQETMQEDTSTANAFVLGQAIGQIQKNYILAQNTQGLIVVDAHAAHERITYEKLKSSFWQDEVMQQELLQPMIFTVSLKEAECVEMHQDTLHRLGLELVRTSEVAVMVRSLPVLLLDANIEQLIHDVIADFVVDGTSFSVEKSLNKILATMACHSSVRAGRSLSINEMNALLRQLEQTDNGGQCGHGRPTWIQLTTFTELQKMFGR